MSVDIVQSREPIVLIGGGEASERDIADAVARTGLIVAADGGAAAALDAGHMPDAVIGDFDSLGEVHRSQIPAERLFCLTEQDSTDFDKALRSISAPVVLAVGFLGARVDHQLAAFSTLLRYPDRSCVLVGASELVFLAPPEIELALEPGDTVSLYPIRQISGRSRGLAWPIDDLTLEPGGRLGTSNKATGTVYLNVEAPGLLVIVPRTAIGPVMRALASDPPSAAARRWPAPGR